MWLLKCTLRYFTVRDNKLFVKDTQVLVKQPVITADLPLAFGSNVSGVRRCLNDEFKPIMADFGDIDIKIFHL